MMICKEKPDNLPPLEAIGLEPVDQSHSINRYSSGQCGVCDTMDPLPAFRSASIAGLRITGTGYGNAGFGSAMGQFSAPGKLASSEERFNRSTSMSVGGGPLSSFTGGGLSSPMVRSRSQGGLGGVGSGMGKHTSKRGEARYDTNRLVSTTPSFGANTMSLEPVAPLE